MKYRVIETVNRKGERVFYPQFRCFFIWCFFENDTMGELFFPGYIDTLWFLNKLSRKNKKIIHKFP